MLHSAIMTEKRRGAPKGNQNARKHGFYSRVLTREEKEDMERAVNLEGLDEEIALLRVKIKSVAEHDPENIALLAEALGTLYRLLQAKQRLSKEDKKGLKEAIGNVLKEIAVPLGIELGEKFL